MSTPGPSEKCRNNIHDLSCKNMKAEPAQGILEIRYHQEESTVMTGNAEFQFDILEMGKKW